MPDLVATAKLLRKRREAGAPQSPPSGDAPAIEHTIEVVVFTINR